MLGCPTCKIGAIDATKLRLRNFLTWIALKCENCEVRKISKLWKCICGTPWYTCAMHASPFFGPLTRPIKKRPVKKGHAAEFSSTCKEGKRRRLNGGNTIATAHRQCARRDKCTGHVPDTPNSRAANLQESFQEYDDSEEEADKENSIATNG